MNRYRKWIDLFLVLLGVALWFLFKQMFSQVWEIFRLPFYSDWPVQLPSLLALFLALLTFVLVKRSLKAITFLEEVAQELSRVVWPQGKETLMSTGVIIVMVGIVSIIMFFFDFLWGTLTKSFLSL